MQLQLIPKDYRFLTNKEILSSLEIKIFQELNKLKDLHLKPEIFTHMDFISPVINLTDLQYVNFYAPIIQFTNNYLIRGSIVTRVYFPNITTIDDLLNTFVSNRHQDFVLKETSSFFYQKKEEDIYSYQYVHTRIIIGMTKKIIKLESIRKKDRIFNISTPKFNKEGIYMAYQKENQYDIAEIITCSEKKQKSYGLIDISKINNQNDDIPLLKKKKIFHSKTKNNKIYQKLFC